ncbi:MAG: hypothetical protein ACJ75K_14655, partial [Actinomycetes bacterium]
PKGTAQAAQEGKQRRKLGLAAAAALALAIESWLRPIQMRAGSSAGVGSALLSRVGRALVVRVDPGPYV